ncbi:polyketide synthase [Nitrincola tibetensis]|uniref:Polyketide synthase n=1 Tax=Nitrincola tibetensis TaxID=2219697 RepID=A0A364NQ06_9GAMM|nr:type I polyketide synthase [Nitrincola tibetensis]RAU19166.1 polyketide synthase [Nitrincola tibetensis]
MKRRVAIVGCSLRIPGTSANSFWQDLLENKDLVTEVDSDRWGKDSFLHPDKRHLGSSYTFAAGSLGDVSGFDAGFFGLSPREVTHMDPQQRLLLEMSWEAMESAGIPPSSLRGSQCGVFVGIASVDYAYRYADDMSAIDANTGTGTASSIASNRISYLFDLHGPSMSMDTACSSSLVAFHQACRAIVSGEIDMALTGGISLHLHPFGFMVFSKATMLSKTGRCQAFDEAGDGYVRSEGGGIFLLKEYEAALADGDPILAVVAGTAANADGNKSGLTIPNPAAQIALMQKAYQEAGIRPDQITYLEAHGTGTSVGDPIETSAIGEALGKLRTQPLPIGSVKSNVGHLETASGVAGLAKALYSIHHRIVPATISVKNANPKILFDEWNIEVVTENRVLSKTDPLVIGINSFGFGGANAHVILMSPESDSSASSLQTDAAAECDSPLPLMLSARSDAALKAMALLWVDHLVDSPDSLYDLAWTATFRREKHHKAMLVLASSKADAAQKLKQFTEDNTAQSVFAGDYLANAQGPVFVYSGNGCQWETMGKHLLNESAVFRLAVEEVNQHFQTYSNFSIIDELQGLNGTGRLVKTEVAQPTLFAIQVGMTRFFEEQGVVPVAVTGHSVGEVAAAWASGALSLADAVKVIYFRSAYQGKTAGAGQMTAVACSSDEIQVYLDEPRFNAINLAGINSAKGITLAGDIQQLTELEAELKEKGVRLKRLDLDYAFHSQFMDVIEKGVIEALDSIQPGQTRIPFYSTVTGVELEGCELKAEYWWHNIRQPVLFKQSIAALLEQGNTVFVEIGAHPVLSGYINEGLRAQSLDGLVVSTLSRDEDRLHRLQSAYAKILLSGALKNFSQSFPVAGRCVDLPNYPWQRDRFWHPVTSESMGLLYRHYEHPLLGYRLKHHPMSWESELDTQRQPWLADHKVGDGVLFPGAGFVDLALAAALSAQARDVLEVEELEILSPLLLSEQHSKMVRLHLLSDSGQLRVESRERGSDEDWNAHLRGRVISQSRGLSLAIAPPVLPSRVPDFTREAHLQAASSIGLDYGPAFQAVQSGWVDQDQVIGRFELSPEVKASLPDFVLHPGVLDSAFQLFIPLLKQHAQDYDGLAFVPTQVGRIQVAVEHQGSCPALTRVRLLKRSPHSLLASVEIFNEQGKALAVLQDVRFKAVPLRKSQQQAVSWLNYYLTPAPLPHMRQPLSLLTEDVLNQFKQGCEKAFSKDVYATDIEPLLDSMADAILCQIFESYADENGQINDWPDTPLALRLRQLAEKQMLLEVNEHGWELVAPPEVGADEIWNALVQEYPAYFSMTHLMGRLSLGLNAYLSGEADSAELELTQERYSELLKQMPGSDAVDLLTTEISNWLAAQTPSLPEGERLSIIEMSSGSPLFGEKISKILDFNVADYVFASFESDAINQANLILESYPLTDVVQLQDGQSRLSLSQGPQLAIVHLDSMSLHEGQAQLKLLSESLMPGAELLVIHHHPALWLDFIYGLQDQWWIDSHQSQQASAEQWSSILAEMGWVVDGRVDLQPMSSGWLMTLCRLSVVHPQGQLEVIESSLSDDAETKRQWFFIEDACTEEHTALGSALVGVMEAHQQSAESFTDIECLTQRVTECSGEGVLHWVLIAEPHQHAVNCSVARCSQLLDLLRLSESLSLPVSIWVVTSGVGATLPVDQPLSKQAFAASDTSLASAMVWGFVRTLMNEVGQTQLRLIDVPSISPSRHILTALVESLLYPDAENEIVISPSGARLAPRLRIEPQTYGLTSAQSNTRELGEALTLGFKLPGQLRNLAWQTKPLKAMGPRDLTVKVKATGLNFRDVMYALGLLSDEAIENGFSGPSLGLEFSGYVLDVGDEVTEFSRGDRVVGFGPSSFSTSIVTSADTLSLMPEGLGYEAAATIPTTFFTVYYALKHLARMEPGERILIHGAAGGVGVAAIQIAQWLGAEIYATVGSQEKRDFLTLMGVDKIYDSRSLTFAEEILADTPDGKGVDVVLNSLAGEAINQNLRVLKPFGRFMELGKRDFYENTAIGLRPFRNNISYFGIDSDQLMKEKPALTQRLFREMMALFEEGQFFALPYSLFSADQVVEAFRYMQQAKQIGKVVINYPQQPKSSKQAPSQTLSPLRLNADATYLVTGGLGGFGLRTAQWLVEKGARHLVLVNRSGIAQEDACARLKELEAQGVQVVRRACDVTQKSAIETLLSEIEAHLPPLRGVVHAATVFEDGLALNLTEAQIRHVFEPKMQGALYLHELTHALDLDLFVLFSSATTLFGNPGQSNYVAANLGLEALASLREQQGLAATCVRWGAIDDVGFLARNEKIKESLQSRMGGDALKSDVALSILEVQLQRKITLLGVMELDWSALNRFLPTADSPKFKEVAAFAGDLDQDAEGRAYIEHLMHTLPPEEFKRTLMDMLKTELSKILLISEDKIDTERSVYDMGFDSLMGVELMTAIDNRFGLQLPVMALSEASSLSKLSQMLIDKLQATDEGSDDVTVEQMARSHGVSIEGALSE